MALPFGVRIAVTAPRGIRYDEPGFVNVLNDDPALGQARSIRLGLAEARRHGADAVLIALADMPFVPPAHFAALLSRYRGGASLIASRSSHSCPPALFGHDWFSRLETLEGDRGAGAWLAEAETIPCAPHWLQDIDTQADLTAFSHD
jgi:molybdenum cofactor cytidylyltransferase